MSNLILTDIDGCVLNWIDSFKKYVKKEKNLNPLYETSYDLSKMFNISYEKLDEIMDDFHKSPYYGVLPTIKYSEKWIPELHKEGYKFIAITNCAFSNEAINKRKDNIQRIFNNNFDDIYCKPYDFNKTELLKMFPTSFWIEDSPKWASCGADVGHETMIMDHPYNSNYVDDRVTRVSCWQEIYNILLS